MEALNALIDIAFHASSSGKDLRRETEDLRRAARRLRDLAHKDSLTGLANRRALEERLVNEWDRSQRYGRPLAVLMGDLDGLKEVNDRYGHQAGDALLQAAASSMRDSLRSGDLAGRIGGDEFLVICPETNRDAIAAVAAKLAMSLEKASVITQRGAVGMRMSIGWAVADQASSVDDLMRVADEALYKAKASRRNRRG